MNDKIRFLPSPDVPVFGSFLVKPNQGAVIEKAPLTAASFICTTGGGGGGGGGYAGPISSGAGSIVGAGGASNSNSGAVGYGSAMSADCGVTSVSLATSEWRGYSTGELEALVQVYLDAFRKQIDQTIGVKLSERITPIKDSIAAYKAERKKDSKPFTWAFGDSMLPGSGETVSKQEPQPPFVHKVEQEEEDNVWLFSKENSSPLGAFASTYQTDAFHSTEEGLLRTAALYQEAIRKKLEKVFTSSGALLPGETLRYNGVDPLTAVPYKEEMGMGIYNPKSVVSTINLDPDKPDEGTIRVVSNGKDIYLRGDWQPYTRVEASAQTVQKAKPKTVNALVHKQLKSFRVQSDAQAYPRYSAHLDN